MLGTVCGYFPQIQQFLASCCLWERAPNPANRNTLGKRTPLHEGIKGSQFETDAQCPNSQKCLGESAGQPYLRISKKIRTNLLKLNPFLFNWLIKKIKVAWMRSLKKQLKFCLIPSRKNNSKSSAKDIPVGRRASVFLGPRCRIPSSRCVHLSTCGAS